MATSERWILWPLSALTEPDGVVLTHSTLAHLPQFLFGVAGGRLLLYLSTRDRDGRAALSIACETLFWLSASGAVLVASAPALSVLDVPYGRYLFPWMAGFVTCAVLTAPFAPLSRRLLDLAPLRRLGRISYGIYVYQIVCLVAVQRIARLGGGSPWPNIWVAAAGFLLTVAVAAASYRFLERPLQQWAERRLRNWKRPIPHLEPVP
jgi:peptidoglycan/LPS O-acetylase OafA/YrhL